MRGGYEAGVDGKFKVNLKQSQESTSTVIAPETLTQAAILRRLKLKKKLFAIVFDEMQNLNDPKLKERIRDLLKALSDDKVAIKVFLVGIGESDLDIILADPSYEDYKMRHFTTARIPPMSIDEIVSIIDRRESLFNTRFDDDIKNDLARIASGFPYIAHTLALYSCYSWIAANAGVLITNWFARFDWVRKWFPVKVQDINLWIGQKEFRLGILRYISEFSRSYEKEWHELLGQLRGENGDEILDLLSRVADCGRDGLDQKKIVRPVSALVKGKLRYIIKISEENNLRLKFEGLGAIIRGCEYLKTQAPDKWEALLNAGENKSLGFAPRSESQVASTGVAPKGGPKV